MRMAATTFQYIQCDIPEGLSIRQWRRERAAEAAVPRTRLRFLLHRARRGIRL